MGNGDAGGSVQSVDRALSILGLLAERRQQRIADIAAALGVHKSTAFRLLATLESHELVEPDAERGGYRLGVGVLRLAGAAAARLDLVQESRPVTRRLAAEVGETVNVTVLSGADALYLDQVSGPSALQLHNWVGQRIPLHATSNGKVLLAHLEPEQAAELLAGPLPAFTERTVTDPARLHAQLAEVRRTGYGTAVDELEVGLTAIAAPVRSSHGVVVASLSASGPTFRLPVARHAAVAASVVRAAAQVSRRLGWMEESGADSAGGLDGAGAGGKPGSLLSTPMRDTQRRGARAGR